MAVAATLPVFSAPRRMTYPRPITSVHQIELTSHCNLRCVYCPSPKLPQLRQQPALHMEMATFDRALDWACYFERQGTQGELALTGIGESLLHPDFVPMLHEARRRLPSNPITLSTNGLLLTDALAREMAKARLRLYVSLHRPEKAGPAIEVAKRHGIYTAANPAAATSSMNWAGQVDWYVSRPRETCAYLGVGWAVVLVDGRITTCCLDASGVGVVGHVDDAPGSLAIAPYSLCATCDAEVP